jgi:hypothetical protein
MPNIIWTTKKSFWKIYTRNFIKPQTKAHPTSVFCCTKSSREIKKLRTQNLKTKFKFSLSTLPSKLDDLGFPLSLRSLYQLPSHICNKDSDNYHLMHK